LIEVRRVAASFEHDTLAASAKRRDKCVHLTVRSVFVLFPLEDERGTGDVRQIVLDVPRAEFRAQPHVGPVLEHRVHVGTVMARQSGAQVSRAVLVAEFSDAVNGNVFDKDVRRFENQRVRIAGARSRIDQRNGRPVTVADEDGALDIEHVDEARQHRKRFVVHEPQRSRRGPRV
jgi:hypothetical protein